MRPWILRAIIAWAMVESQARTDEASDPKGKDDKKNAKAWEDLGGRWKRVGIRADGRYGDLRDSEVEIEIKQGRMNTYAKGELVPEHSDISIEINPTKTPAEIDFINHPKGLKRTVTKGIYRFEDGALEILFYLDASVRPTGFGYNDQDARRPRLIIYERAKMKK